MVAPLLALGGIAALIFMFTKSKGAPAPGSFLPDPTGILPPVSGPTVVTGKSGTQWLSQVVGSNEAKNTIRVQVIANDGRLGRPNHLVLTYDAVRGSNGARTFVARGPNTTDGIFAAALKDFAVKT